MNNEAVVVVTGGGSGMGRDIALDQARLGHDVLIVGRREHALRETASLATGSGQIRVAVADTSTDDGAATVRNATQGRAVRAVVAAAGGQGDFKDPGHSLADIDAAWSEALRQNLFSALLPIEALLPHMPQDEGRIVLIGSTAGLDGAGGPYATAKAALAGYGRDLAVRVAQRGITANTVAPGFVSDTGFFTAGGFGDGDAMAPKVAEQTLLGRVGRPRDITACVRWLLDIDSGWITGQTIAVDGGNNMLR